MKLMHFTNLRQCSGREDTQVVVLISFSLSHALEITAIMEPSVMVLNGQLPWVTGGSYISALFFYFTPKDMAQKGQCEETEQRHIVITMSAQFDSLKMFWLVLPSLG